MVNEDFHILITIKRWFITHRSHPGSYSGTVLHCVTGSVPKRSNFFKLRPKCSNPCLTPLITQQRSMTSGEESRLVIALDNSEQVAQLSQRNRAILQITQGQSSFKVIENGTIRKLGYGCLFAFHSNYYGCFDTIHERYRQTPAGHRTTAWHRAAKIGRWNRTESMRHSH